MYLSALDSAAVLHSQRATSRGQGAQQHGKSSKRTHLLQGRRRPLLSR